MTEELNQQLVNTNCLHGSLRADPLKTVEARLLSKPALGRRALWDGRDPVPWRQEGIGEISVPEEGTLRLTLPARTDHWPQGASTDGDYSPFGHARAVLDLPREDLRAYNRLTCRIRPCCGGYSFPLARLEWRNEGLEPVPDAYRREGFHDLNLENSTWNDCVWEFPDLPRDAVTQIALAVTAHGTEPGSEGMLRFDLSQLELGYVQRPDVALGWQGNADTIAFSTSGYWVQGAKTAITNILADTFALLMEDTGQAVFEGPVRRMENEKGLFGLVDFTPVRVPGTYRLKVGELLTLPFPIHRHVMEDAAWKVIHFFYRERCGYPVSGGHSSCHQDILARHGGLTLPYCGGWHDAGDLSQQTLQTAEAVHSLLCLAETVLPDWHLHRRLVEEAEWGLDFVLRTRFGDGYRATSAGACRWTDGLAGNMDDVQARVHNRSLDNFLMAAVEACAARLLGEGNPALAFRCHKAAREDFHFALERFEALGVEEGEPYEHTYNAGPSQYSAAACWAAAELHRLQPGEEYARQAVRFAQKLLSCQEKGSPGVPMAGFFYREPEHKTISHFNHQAREHLFLQALASTLTALPRHRDQAAWEEGMELYGQYLKGLFAHAAPYGMLPAGLHSYSEIQDRDTFTHLHLLADFDRERENYRLQLDSGVPLAPGYVLRHFPVWFSFRGNNAVLLSSAKAASLIGRHLQDQSLLDIAREQLYWVSGKNPFGQSLIYGEGSNYAQQYAALAGEMVGEMPVGVQTRANEDRPYWPMANNATYKEVWGSVATRWLGVLADLY